MVPSLAGLVIGEANGAVRRIGVAAAHRVKILMPAVEDFDCWHVLLLAPERRAQISGSPGVAGPPAGRIRGLGMSQSVSSRWRHTGQPFG